MKNLLCLIFILLFCQNITAQDVSEVERYEQILDESFAVYNAEMFAYIDSLAMQGDEYVWYAQFYKANQYRMISDSLKEAERLINECIDYYEQTHTTGLLIESLKISYFINKDLSQFQGAIGCLNQGIELAVAAGNSSYAAYFEGELGYLYLSYLEDTVNALPHIENGISTALEIEAWDYAKLGASHLMEYYLLVGDTAKARNASELALEYSLRYEPTDPRHYEGHNGIAQFFLRIGELENAIRHGIILVDKGQELENETLLIVGALTLTQAYFETDDLQQAHHYLQIASEATEVYGQTDMLEYQHFWGTQIYEALGITEKALASLKKYVEIHDAYNDESSKVSITKTLFQGELEREKIEKEKVELTLSLAQEEAKFQFIVIVSILGLLLAMAFYALLIYRKKQKEIQLNRVLTASNEVVLKQKEQLKMSVDELQKNLEEIQLEADSYYFAQSAIQIKFEEIIMLESSNNYVLIHVVDRKNPLLERVKMIELVEGFPTNMFMKIHRSFYVNVNHIISRPSKYLIKMSNETVLTASRNYVDNLGDKFLG